MLYEYLLLFFCTIPLTMLASPGLALLFEKAGVDKNKAYIPVVNQLTLLKITGKHPLNIILEYVPIINIISYVLDLIDFIHCYNKKSFLQQMATLFGFPIYFFIIGKDPDTKYLGTLKEVEASQPKAKWYSSLIFAVVAATIVRWAFIEAYKIPTSSMEGSMLVNDFLFVSKIHYGPRTPQTPLQLPLTHQQVPFFGFKSYSTAIQLPSFRLFGFTDIQRGKPMVFNYPYDEVTDVTDMKTFYVKRCVAIAGDTISYVDGQLYISGKKVEDNENVQYQYQFKVKGNVIKDTMFTQDGNNRNIAVQRLKDDVMDEWKITNNEDFSLVHSNVAYALLSKSNVDRVRNSKYVDTSYFVKHIMKKDEVSPYVRYFPYHTDTEQDTVNGGLKMKDKTILSEDLLRKYKFKWNVDNFGPLWIPKKGVTISLNEDNVTIYASTIARYEGFDKGKVSVIGSKLFINGVPQETYTFKQNYYWLCGDNRHNSLDSRFWGFVPEDHVVGKPFLTFMSLNKYNTNPFNKIRWNRIFRFVE